MNEAGSKRARDQRKEGEDGKVDMERRREGGREQRRDEWRAGGTEG